MSRKFLALLIPYILIVCTAMTNVTKAQQFATVSVHPSSYEVSDVGIRFPIKINVTEVTELWSWKIKLSWNESVLTIASSADVVEGPFKPPGMTMFLGVPSPGEIGELSSTSMAAPKQGVTGNGTLAIIYFTSVGLGTTDVVISEPDFIDKDDVDIWMTPTPGEVTVIPEFPASMILPLFLILTAAIAIATKIFWSRRHRGHINAQ